MKLAITTSWEQMLVNNVCKRQIIWAFCILMCFQAGAQTQRSTAKKKRAVQRQTAVNATRSDLQFSRQTLAIPSAGKTPSQTSQVPIDLQAVKPPPASEFYEKGDTQEAQYEALLDQEIRQLYYLSKKYEKSPSKGEYWLRLAERYSEKAQLVGFRAQAKYDLQIQAFIAKKTRVRPVLDNRGKNEYTKKAVQLYEWFIREYPRDPKVDQALFFLGYSWFELGDSKKGEAYYLDLVRRYPDSVYVVESYFALGEFYFEHDRWQPALESYSKVIEQKRARLHAFALYKAAWCLYRMSQPAPALKYLERVIRLGRSDEASEKIEGRRAVNKIRLASEALKDYVPFYAESGEYQNARSEFLRISGSEEQADKMLERLAYVYRETGNKIAANAVFKQLIARNPTAEKAADYQYQIALTYQTSDQRKYREELEFWLANFGPQSAWAQTNAANGQLVQDTAKLQEATVRNFVLRQHQAAQNSHAPFSQQQANAGYALYGRFFPDSPKAVEMTFFHAELLFDLEKYDEAAKLYLVVADKDAKGIYGEKAAINAMLALEKSLPSQKELDERRAGNLNPIPLDPPAERFEKAALRYLAIKPHGDKSLDIKRRLGVLYYSYNQFDKATAIFEEIVHESPKSKNAEVAGNLILDMYKLRGDMPGLVDRGRAFLADPQVANTKFGTQIRTILEKASYLSAEKLVEKKDYAKGGQEFERFASANGNSDLAEAARYKAASSYEKGGMTSDSIRMHQAVLAVPASDSKVIAIQNDSRNDLARLYSKTGQLEQAAKQYQDYANSNPKNVKASNAYYNAGVLFDSLDENAAATRNYDLYYAKSAKADRSQILFLEAEMARKAGDRERASRLYEKYTNENGRTSERTIQSYFWIARFAESGGQNLKAKSNWQKVLESYRLSKLGVRYAAEARFRLAHDSLLQIQALRFQASEKQQAQVAALSETLRKKYLDEMKEVIRFDHAPFIVAALVSSGEMFEALAKTYSSVPAPPGYSADDAKKLSDLAMGRANEYRNEASKSYRAAYDKSFELETYGEWSRQAREGLARYDSSISSSNSGDVVSDASSVDWMGM